MNEGSAKGNEGAERLREASRWFVQHESTSQLSPKAWRDWERWTADPANSSEFDEMVDLHRDVLSLPRPQMPAVSELLADTGDADTPGGPGRGLSRVMDIFFWRRPMFHTAGVAALLSAIACVGLAILWRASGIVDPGESYRTRPGQHLQVRLRDGSTVTLGGGSSIVVRLTDRSRTVILSRGEALFQVKHDPARSFSVVADEGKITAVGTVFDVRRYSKTVRVAVTEGTVEIMPLARGSEHERLAETSVVPTTKWRRVRVTRGREMSYDNQGDATRPRAIDVSNATSWMRGTIVYYGRPLQEVVEDLQRYSESEIELDPAAGELQYSGIVHQRHLGQWISRLPEIFPVEVVYPAPKRVQIRARPHPLGNGDPAGSTTH